MPDIYEEVKNAIKYRMDTLMLEIVIDSLRIKEMKIKTEKHDKKNGKIDMKSSQFKQNSHDGHQSSCESNSNGGKKKGKNWFRSKFRTKDKKRYGCENMGHFINICCKENE